MVLRSASEACIIKSLQSSESCEGRGSEEEERVGRMMGGSICYTPVGPNRDA